MVREEIRQWDPRLLERPQLVAASKRDAVEEPDRLPDLVQAAAALGLDVIPVSAHSGEGLRTLVQRLHGLLLDRPAASREGAAP
jgi:GTP-binding protein